MKGDSEKGKAWANAVRATIYPSNQPVPKLKKKLSFLDHIDREKKEVFIMGDFAPAFGLLDNHDLSHYINVDSVSELSTYENFHIRSSSSQAIKKVATQLDDALTAGNEQLTLSAVDQKASLFSKIRMSIEMLKFLRIKDPFKKWMFARNILGRSDSSYPLALIAWEEIAETYFSQQNSIHLAESLFRKIQVVTIEKKMGKSGAYSAERVGQCLYIKEQWNEAIEFLEKAILHGFKSLEINDIIALSRAKLEDNES